MAGLLEPVPALADGAAVGGRGVVAGPAAVRDTVLAARRPLAPAGPAAGHRWKKIKTMLFYGADDG